MEIGRESPIGSSVGTFSTREDVIVNHRRSPWISHRTQPLRQKKEDVRRNTENWPLGLEVGEACAKRGRTRSSAG